MKLSTRFDEYTTGVFTELAAEKRSLQAQGRDVIDLSIGSPDLPPERRIMSAFADAAMQPENYVYAVKDATWMLSAARDWYERRFNVNLNPNTEIMSLIGSQDGLAHLTMAICDPGDIVIVPDPGYPIFSMGPILAGAQLYKVAQRAENGFVMDLRDIPEDVAQAAKLMIVSYPNNPVTSCASPEFYAELVAFAKKYDIAVLHDNAYCELTFDGYQAGSFLQYPGAKDVGVEFNSLSKTYNLAGLRTGFALGNAAIIDKLRSFKSHIDYGMFIPAQYAATEALSGSQDCVKAVRAVYQKRRDVLIAALNDAGWAIDPPRATMFVWAKLPSGYVDSAAFAKSLMQSTGVVVVPGVSFGQLGEGYVRMALVQSEDKLLKAALRIKQSGIVSGA